MNSIYLPLQPFLEAPVFACHRIRNWAMNKAFFVKRILDKHTDVISNLGILAITTCLLAAKIFESTPKILPRLAKVVYDYGGIIWLNVQVRDFLKSGKDFLRAWRKVKFAAIIETSGKVVVKGTNILLTCVIFAASVASAVAFPEVSLIVALSVRPLALSCLLINICSDIRDYFANKALLKRLEQLEASAEGSMQIQKIITCFLEIVKNQNSPACDEMMKVADLADALVRQLDHYTLETFQESLERRKQERNPFVETMKLYYGIKDGMFNSQAATEGNLSLLALGYAAMGISRALPGSLADMAVRWGMSVLYTDEFIQRKFFQADLSKRIN